MVIFNSYVKLPEGNPKQNGNSLITYVTAEKLTCRHVFRLLWLHHRMVKPGWRLTDMFRLYFSYLGMDQYSWLITII